MLLCNILYRLKKKFNYANKIYTTCYLIETYFGQIIENFKIFAIWWLYNISFKIIDESLYICTENLCCSLRVLAEDARKDHREDFKSKKTGMSYEDFLHIKKNQLSKYKSNHYISFNLLYLKK